MFIGTSLMSLWRWVACGFGPEWQVRSANTVRILLTDGQN